MRVYFEKPRTTVGWKGLINDPHMDNSFRINDGLRIARKLLLDINDSSRRRGIPRYDHPQYVADLMSWAPSARVPPNPRCTVSSPPDLLLPGGL